jgi:hypothetical protein
MGLLGAGIDLAQDDLVWDLDPSRLLAKPGEPSVAANFGCRRLAVSDFLVFFLSQARIAAAAADVRPLPGPVVVGVEFVMMPRLLRQPIARSCPGEQQAEDTAHTDTHERQLRRFVGNVLWDSPHIGCGPRRPVITCSDSASLKIRT